MTPLVQKWRRDTSQAWDRRRLLAERTPTAPSESLRVTRALQLIADGELSRAQAMLLSEGIHDWLKLGSGVGWRRANCHFRGAGREPREENFGAT